MCIYQLVHFEAKFDMKTVITGGTGLIGREVARQLVDRGDEVILFDIIPRETMWADIKEKVTFVQGDLSNWMSVLNLVKEYQPQSIFHLGARLSHPSEVDPWATYQVNINGLIHVLEAARLFGVEKVIFPSSIAAVMCPEVPDMATDFTLQRPRLLYGVTKVFGELLGRFYNKKFNLDFRAIRYSVVVAPGVKTMGVAQCLPWAVEHAIKGIPYDLWLEPEFSVAVLYYKDAARATIMLHDVPQEQIQTMCYNVIGINLPSVQDFVNVIKKQIPEAKIGFKPDSGIMQALKGQTRAFDESRAREEWEWGPKYTVDAMIQDFIAEVRTNKELYE
jgi:nucleoside-diphosphate-sugar epimerase